MAKKNNGSTKAVKNNTNEKEEKTMNTKSTKAVKKAPKKQGLKEDIKKEEVKQEPKETVKKVSKKEEKAAAKAAAENATLMNKADLVSTVFNHMEKKGLVSYHWQGKMPNLMAVRAGKKTAAEIYVGKKDYRINVRQTVFDAAGIDGYTTIKNYYLPACKKHIPLTDTETAVKVIDQIANLYAEYIPTQEQAAE